MFFFKCSFAFEDVSYVCFFEDFANPFLLFLNGHRAAVPKEDQLPNELDPKRSVRRILHSSKTARLRQEDTKSQGARLKELWGCIRPEAKFYVGAVLADG